MWDLSSPTRDWTFILCIGRWILNQWTTREVPKLYSLCDGPFSFLQYSITFWNVSQDCTLLTDKKTVSAGQIFSKFSSRLWRGSLARFSHCFLLLSFSSIPGLEPGQKVWGGFVRIQREAMLQCVGYCPWQGPRPWNVVWIGFASEFVC